MVLAHEGVCREQRAGADHLRVAGRDVERVDLLVLVLGGVYLGASTLIRLFVTSGPIADFGLPVLAIVLAAVFVLLAQDPVAPEPPK